MNETGHASSNSFISNEYQVLPDQNEPSSGIPTKKVATVKPNLRKVEESSGPSTFTTEETRPLTPLLLTPGKASPVTEFSLETESIQLLRQLWNTREEGLQFYQQIHSLINTSSRRLQFIQSEERKKSHLKRLSDESGSLTKNDLSQPLHALLDLNETESRKYPGTLFQFISTIKSLTGKIEDLEKTFRIISNFQTQCKLVLYAKVLHARKYMLHDYHSILYAIPQLITILIHILATSSTSNLQYEIWTDNWTSITESIQIYNSSAQALFQSSYSEVNGEGGGKGTLLAQVNGIIQNDGPGLVQNLKPLSIIRILSLFIRKRVLPASHALSRTILSTFNNQSNGTGSSENMRASPPITPQQFQFCLDREERCLEEVGKVIMKNVDGERKINLKLMKYYRETLWNSVGETATELLLWGTETGVPFILFSNQDFIQIQNGIRIGIQIGDWDSSSIVLGLETFLSSIHSLTLQLTWDNEVRHCFQSASEIKRPEQLELREAPSPGQWATLIAQEFGDIVTTGMSLIESPENPLGNSGNDEEGLVDEAQILFRIEATLSAFMTWLNKRTKAWLNSWSIHQFIPATQRDAKLLWQLVKSKDSVLVTRTLLLNNENTSIRLSAQQRQLCAEDLKETLTVLHGLPEELLRDIGPICETLSLATLQSSMPNSKHWEGMGSGSGLGPGKPSPYVGEFINKVIDPVIGAAVQFLNPQVQEAVGKEVVNASCNAWLDYILQTKVKFSEWGAVQLLRDFLSFRNWIKSETGLESSAKKAILELEVLKKCEGVAYLLLRSPGDILGVGKPSKKNRKLSGTNQGMRGSREDSPSPSQCSVAEDDIPPEMYVPNQQIWLELRLRQKVLRNCCSC